MALIESSSVTAARGGQVAFTERDGEHTVVWLQGEHDASTMVALSEILAQAIAMDDGDLVLDLSGVQFLGAATIGVIIQAREFLRLRSRSLVLRSPSRRAGRVLNLCGLLDPALVDATAATGTADALGTWVAVPTTDRGDEHADAGSPMPRGENVAGRRGT